MKQKLLSNLHKDAVGAIGPCHSQPQAGGNIPTQMNQSPWGRAQGWTNHGMGWVLSPLKCYRFFLLYLCSLLGQTQVIIGLWKPVCLTTSMRPLGIKEIRTVMSKTRLNKRKWGQPFFCCRPSTFRVTQGTHILSSGGEEKSRWQKPATWEISVSCWQGWSKS